MTVNVAHIQATIDASLTAAWLKRCGPTGVPGDWMIPGEFVEIDRSGEPEIDLYPIYAVLRDDGTPKMWGAFINEGPDRTDAWEWRIDVGWDDKLPDELVSRLEDEFEACLDERRTTFMSIGSHQERPPIPDGLAGAIAALKEHWHG